MSEKEGIISMTLQEILDNGVRCYQNGDIKGAIFYFEHYVQYDNDNDEVLHLLVQLKCEVNNYSQAVRLSEKLVEDKPENNEYKFTLAKALFFNNSLSKAEKILLFLKDKFPLNSDILNFLENIYVKQGDRLSARSIINLKDKVEKEIDPVKQEISKTVTLASTMIEEDKIEEARLLLEGALSLDHENLHANGLIAMLLMDECSYKEAVVFFERIKHKMVHEYYESYALAIEKCRGNKAAIDILEEAVVFNPCDDSLKKKLGILYFNVGEYRKAHKMLSQVFDLTMKDQKFYAVSAVSRFQSIEEKGKWINLELLKSVKAELEFLNKKYPDDELVSFYLMKYYLNVGELKKSYDVLCSSTFSDLSSQEWNKHPYFMAKRDRESFFKSYLHGHKNRLKLPLDSLNDRIWKGQSLKGKRVVIMREQGIGDEILFAHNYRWIICQADSVSIFSAERLVESFSKVFHDAKIYPVFECEGLLTYPEEYHFVIYEADVIVFPGDIGAYYYQNSGETLFDKNYFLVDNTQLSFWSDRVQSISSGCGKPKVGLIWRGGYVNGLRSSHYLNEKDVSEIVSALPEVEFFNCMYVDCKKELNYIQKKAGRKIHHFGELDQKNDFESTAAMLSNLDLLVGAYTATLSLAVAVGTPVVAYGADYLKEDGVLKKEAFHYTNVSHVSLPINDSVKRKEAINTIIDEVRRKLLI